MLSKYITHIDYVKSQSEYGFKTRWRVIGFSGSRRGSNLRRTGRASSATR